MTKKKTVIIVVGPTASGKTAVAIDLAKHFNTEIISADSRQCFKELTIGVARPSIQQLQAVRHHFIASHSIHDNVNAATFEEYALDKTTELFKKHETIIITGGTGLYIRAFQEGLDAIPDVPAEIRERIMSDYEKQGLNWLQNELQRKDPKYFESRDRQNPQRLMRALEVTQATGRSILEFQKGKKEQRDFSVIKVGLELAKEELQRRIDARVDQMIAAGLIEEAKGLIAYRDLNALQTVGYSEIFDFIDGKISLTEAIEQIKRNTRQYAKRQMTWFRKDSEIQWHKSFNAEDVNGLINSILRS